MARKNKKYDDSMTPRQKQSQRIMREKKARKTRQNFFKRMQLAAAIIIIPALLGACTWMWISGMPGRVLKQTADGVYALTARAGFAVQSLYLDGRIRTPMSDIETALAVKKGDPILRLSLDELRERLESVPSIRFAAVERELPGTLYVHIHEREPVALWQNQGKIALIDDNGIVMQGIDIGSYHHLPLLVGEGATKHVSELLSMLASDPTLASRVQAAVRIGDRRWNVRLSKGIEVKLPENDAAQAWAKLADLQKREQLLDRDVKVVDLRLPDRLFIRVAPEDVHKVAPGAKET